jgi:hypothetical protein
MQRHYLKPPLRPAFGKFIKAILSFPVAYLRENHFFDKLDKVADRGFSKQDDKCQSDF